MDFYSFHYLWEVLVEVQYTVKRCDVQVIEVLTQDFSRRKQPLFFYNLKPSVVAVFEGIKPKDFVVYYDEHQLDNLLIQHTWVLDFVSWEAVIEAGRRSQSCFSLLQPMGSRLCSRPIFCV